MVWDGNLRLYCPPTKCKAVKIDIGQGMRKFILTVLALIPLALLLIGGLNKVHPLADSLAVFRLPIGVLTILSGAMLWPFWPRKYSLMVITLGLVSSGAIIVSMSVPKPASEAAYVFYQKNLLYRNTDLTPLAADIQYREADFISLQEVTNDHKIVLDLLKETHPSQHFCKFASVGGVAVVSKHPKIAGSEICNTVDGMAAMQVSTPDGVVWLVSIHLRWPYPYKQAQQVQALLPRLEALDGPIFLGGDFNMVSWSNTMSLIEQASGSHRIGHTNGTFRLEGVFNMPIDHILVPKGFGGDVKSLELLGSDHQGVEGRIKPL